MNAYMYVYNMHAGDLVTVLWHALVLAADGQHIAVTSTTCMRAV
jgi:hypothetical protein